MLRNPTFAKLCLKVMCVFRKFYSPVIFWLLWFLWIRWTINVEERYAAKVIWDEILHTGTMAEFRERLKRYDWQSEPAGGLLDFTYQIPWLNFCGVIPITWGRDCDDFAELSWKWCEIHGFDTIWQVMSINGTVKSAHIITVAYKQGIYAVMSNTDSTKIIAAESIEKTLNGYYPQGTVWNIYKKEKFDN